MKAWVYLLTALALTGCGGGSAGTSAVSDPASTSTSTSIPTVPTLPTTKILIVGDTLSVAWEPVVAKKEAGIAIVTHALMQSGYRPVDLDSATEAANIDTWLAQDHYTIVHVDAELDYDICHGTPHMNSVTAYVANLTYIVAAIRAAGATPIYATGAFNGGALGYCHPTASLLEYNAAAVAQMQILGVEVDDLYLVLLNQPGYMTPRIGGLTESGAEAVADSVIQSFGYIAR